ncbi:MarR family transcriptional regulator [Kineosporiaceae bacterium SCSIO 59966]|nr:MarR family transcriptional regulator [Kineosporiaceae bacterium SCSIO 59966]
MPSAPMPSASQCRPAPLAADLRVALMRSVRRLRQEKSSEAISDGQYAVLSVLDKHGPMTPRELAAHENVQPPSMTRTLNALVDAGLVERTDHPDDGRQVLISISEAGAREVAETRKRRDAWLTRRLAELSAEDREVLARAALVLREVVAR